MMSIRRVLVCLAIGCLFSTTGSALTWIVEARVFATEKPIDQVSSTVRGRGIHRLSITSISVADQVFPIRSRLITGELRWEGQRLASCSTAWGWAARGIFYRECRTEYILDPCESGVWTSYATGKLEGHPRGGIKFSTSLPRLLNCTCT